MEPNTGIKKFIDYSTTNLEFFGTLKKEGVKIGFDTYNNIFYVIGEQLGTEGIGKGEHGSWSHQFQRANQVTDRLRGYINTSSEILVITAKELSSLNAVILELEAELSKFNHTKADQISDEDLLQLEQGKSKLDALVTTMKAASKGLMILSFAPLENPEKELQAASYCGQSELAKAQKMAIKGFQKQINELLTPNKQKLEAIHSKAAAITEQSSWFSSSFYGITSTLSSGANMITSAVVGLSNITTSSISSATTAIQDAFYDGDHFWKQQKWHLIMQQSIKGLEKQMNMTFETIESKLKGEITKNELQQLDASFDKQVLEMLNKLKNSGEAINVNDNKRQCYIAFITALREVATSEGYQKELEKAKNTSTSMGLKVLLELCNARLTDVHIFPFCDYIVHKVIDSGKTSGHTPSEKLDIVDQEVPELTEADFERIDNMDQKYGAQRAAVTWGKFRGTMNFGFDPHIQSNAPFTLGTMEISDGKGGFRNLTLIRMGSPTIDYTMSTSAFADINPEFQTYLDYCALKGKKHLYISLQSDLSKLIGSENHRNNALRSLTEKYPGTFTVVVLDQDSSFYHQKGDFSVESMKSEEFLDSFLARMLGENKGYFFPDAWKKDEKFTSALKTIADNTLNTMFGVLPETMTPAQRKDFIELFHAQLGFFLPVYSKADNMNVSCKDAIDRAMKMISLMVKTLNIAQGHDKSPEHQNMHRVYTHAPALLVKKQPIIEERMKRLVSAHDYLNNEEVQKRICNSDISQLPINYKGDFKFEKPEGQQPSEIALTNFSNVLSKKILKEDHSILFDQDYLEQLNRKYIQSDLFIPFDSSNEFEEQFNDGLAMKLQFAAKGLKKSELGVKAQPLKQLISELIYFYHLRPGAMKHIDKSRFKEHLDYCLMWIGEEPKTLLNAFQFLNKTGHFDPETSIAQKLFNLSSFNIQSQEMRDRIIIDPLFDKLKKSPQLLSLIGISSEVKTTNAYIASERFISNPLEMLILGEAAIEQVGDNLNDIQKKNVLEAKGILRLLRKQLERFAEGDIKDSELKKLHGVWKTVINKI